MPDPAVVALVAAAVLELWPPGVTGAPAGAAADAEEAAAHAQLVWRFSGRWWSQPLPVRRSRPWTG